MTTAVCIDCQGRLLLKVPPSYEQVKTVNPYLLVHAVKSLAKKKQSVEQIKFALIARFPHHEKYITNCTIIAILKQLCNIKNVSLESPFTHIIEPYGSIFVGEIEITLKSTAEIHPIHTWILCAISSKGLYKLVVGVGEATRPCNQLFVQSIYNNLELDPKRRAFQIVVKPSMSDISEVEKIFSRYSLHKLCYYSPSGKVDPAHRYLRRLVSFIPRDFSLNTDGDYQEQTKAMFKGAKRKITKKDCKRWIEHYLQRA